MRFVIIGLLLVPLASQAAPEIGNVIKRALQEQQNGSLPWSFLARNELLISWKTRGVEGDQRQGEVVLAVNGFVPEQLKERVEPAVWSLTLTGNKFGAYLLELQSEACFGSASASPNCSSRLGQIDKSLLKENVQAALVCEFGPGSAHTQVYKVAVSGKPPGYLAIDYGEGSGGSFWGTRLILQQPEKGSKDIQHTTAVCSKLYQMGMGSASSVAYLYQFLGAEK